MRGGAVRPPRLATALLRLSLPKGVVRDTVLGDFWELHRRRVIVGSALDARLWYWRQTMGLSTRTLFAKLRRGGDGMATKTPEGASPAGGASRTGPPDDPRARRSAGAALEAVVKDVRYACRTLAATPGFALVAVVTLGIGIGAVTLMFSTLDGVVLRQLPYADPGKLVSVASLTPRGEENSSSAVDYLDYRARASSFEALAAVLVFSPGRVVIGEAEPERVRSTMVSANFFSMLGVDVAEGRTFAADEEVVGGPDVVILGHAYWQRRYGGDAGVVGESILIDGSPHEVIGVLPAQFWYPKAVDMWFPMRVGDGWTEGRGNRNFSMLGRLAPGVSLEQAGAQMSSLAAQLATEYPDADDGWGVGLTPLRSRFFGDTLPALLVLSLASGLFLVVACANLSSLVLARVTTRRSELAVRAALGASRIAIIRQLVVESLLIALVGAAAGVSIAWLGLRAIRDFGPADLPRLETIALDGKVLAFTVLITVLSGLLFGLLPALRGTGQRAALQLRAGGTASASASSLRLRNALVVGQMGLSLTLLLGSGLLVRSFFRLTAVDPGFDPAGVITFQLQPPAFRYDSAEALDQFFTEALDRMASLSPDIEVSGTTYLPLMGGPWNEVHAADEPPADASEERGALRRRVFEGYFETMRIPLLAGRTFERSDTEGAPPVVVISRRLAEEFFPGGDALGNVLMLPGWGEDGALAQQVIGIVDDVSDYGLGVEPSPVFYMPFRQVLSRSVAIALRTEGDPAAAIDAARQAIWTIDDDVPLADITLMETSLTESIAQVRFQTTLLALFAAAALFMSAMGLYGVLAFFVSQRGREVGVRMALGATSADVIARVLRQGSVLVVLGLGLGSLGGISAAHLLQSMLFETGSFDLLTYAVVSGVLLAAALGASIVPALRASRVDPVQVIRSG